MNCASPLFLSSALSLFLTIGAVSGAKAASQDADNMTPAQRAALCAEAEREAAKQGLLPSGPSKDGKSFTVLMYKYHFCPATAKIAKGSKVTWLNVDKRTSHSVWFKFNGKTESDRIFNGESFSLTLDKPGMYQYLCGPHWEKEGMVGAIEVTP